MGPRIQAFEAAFARHLGVRHAVALSSGNGGASPRLPRRGVGPGDEVIVPAITFVATRGRRAVLRRHASAGRHRRARTTSASTPTDVEAALTERTKAVCAVHYAGYPAAVESTPGICAPRAGSR